MPESTKKRYLITGSPRMTERGTTTPMPEVYTHITAADKAAACKSFEESFRTYHIGDSVKTRRSAQFIGEIQEVGKGRAESFKFTVGSNFDPEAPAFTYTEIGDCWLIHVECLWKNAQYHVGYVKRVEGLWYMETYLEDLVGIEKKDPNMGYSNQRDALVCYFAIKDDGMITKERFDLFEGKRPPTLQLDIESNALHNSAFDSPQFLTRYGTIKPKILATPTADPSVLDDIRDGKVVESERFAADLEGLSEKLTNWKNAYDVLNSDFAKVMTERDIARLQIRKLESELGRYAPLPAEETGKSMTEADAIEQGKPIPVTGELADSMVAFMEKLLLEERDIQEVILIGFAVFCTWAEIKNPDRPSESELDIIAPLVDAIDKLRSREALHQNIKLVAGRDIPDLDGPLILEQYSAEGPFTGDKSTVVLFIENCCSVVKGVPELTHWDFYDMYVQFAKSRTLTGMLSLSDFMHVTRRLMTRSDFIGKYYANLVVKV